MLKYLRQCRYEYQFRPRTSCFNVLSTNEGGLFICKQCSLNMHGVTNMVLFSYRRKYLKLAGSQPDLKTLSQADPSQ